MQDRQATRSLEPLNRRTRVLVALLFVASLVGTAGCSTHRAAVTNPCPVVSKQGTIVVTPNRGAIAMAKVGLTPKSLKTQQKCG